MCTIFVGFYILTAQASNEGTKIPTSQTKIEIPTGPIANGTCVGFIQSLGFDYHGNAKDWKEYINSYFPEVGEVMLTNESSLGHLSFITKVSFGKIEIIEQNFKGWGVISTRSVSMFDQDIIGFIKR